GLERGPVTAARGAHLGAVRHGLGPLGQDRPQRRRGRKPRGEQGGHVSPYARTRWAIAPTPDDWAAWSGTGAAPSRRRGTLPQLLTLPGRGFRLFSSLCTGPEPRSRSQRIRVVRVGGRRAVRRRSRRTSSSPGRRVLTSSPRRCVASLEARGVTRSLRPVVERPLVERGVAGSAGGLDLLGRGLPGRAVEQALHHQGRVAARGEGEGHVQLPEAAVQLVRLGAPEHELARLDEDVTLLVLEEEQ